MSKIGVGELNDWKNSVAGVDWYEYMSITPYYVFGDGDYTKIQSNIALYLVGEKDYAKSLEIVLNIGYQQDKQEALNLFKRTIKQVEQLLNAGIDMLWIENKIEVGGDIELEIFGNKTSDSNYVEPPKRPSYPEACGLRHLAFRVTNIEEVVKELEQKGISCQPIRKDTFTGEKMTFFADPDGLPLELHE